MKIPVKVFETITYDEWQDLNANPQTGYATTFAPSTGFSDFLLGATYYKVSYHSGCRHTWVNKELKGVIAVYVGGVFRKRLITGAPGEQCSGCGLARYT